MAMNPVEVHIIDVDRLPTAEHLYDTLFQLGEDLPLPQPGDMIQVTHRSRTSEMATVRDATVLRRKFCYQTNYDMDQALTYLSVDLVVCYHPQEEVHDG